MRSAVRRLLSVVSLLTLCLALADEPTRPMGDSLDRDYAADLPRVPAVEPKDALGTLVVAPGYRVDLVAHEPLISDPTAIAFDEDSRAYVVQMRSYSEDAEKNLCNIALLTDQDGDGKFDARTQFATGLSWATAVHCWKGGVFVAVPPDILYLKDTDGDGKADVKETIYTGFSRANVQGLVNSFNWGLDNRIHAATSSSGAQVKSLKDPTLPELPLRGRDFCFDPATFKIVPTSGGAQHGLSFDRWGNKYVCSNSDHLQMVMFEDRYVARNPYLAGPGPRKSIAADGPAADVYRASPVEAWREIRTRLRAQKIVPGVVEGGGRPAGYFTGATGATIYRGHLLPTADQGVAVIGDAGGNLVHRKRLEPDGVGYLGTRVDEKSEFVASTDIWFRPVQFANAPDGALYILDMYREVIEHPASLPPIIKKHLDLTSGRDRGRIYRIVPSDYKQQPLPKWSKAPAADLVAQLDSPNGWSRETAARLLYDRQDRSIVPLLERQVVAGKAPEGRIQTAWTLDGLQGITKAVVFALLDDKHPRVREHGVKLAERLITTEPTLLTKLLGLQHDPDVRVRYQLAFTLGEAPASRPRNLALATLAQENIATTYFPLAVQSSLTQGAGEVVQMLAADANFVKQAAGATLIESLAKQIGTQRLPTDLPLLATVLAQKSLPDALASRVVKAALTGAGKNASEVQSLLEQAGGGKLNNLVADMIASAKKTASDANAKEPARVAALMNLSIAPFDQVKSLLNESLDYRQPAAIQRAAIATLGRFADPGIAGLLLGRFEQLSPALRQEAMDTLLSREAWAQAVLSGIADKKVPVSHLSSMQANLLKQHSNAKLAAQADDLLSSLKNSARADVLTAYQPAVTKAGDVEKGRAIFRKICAQCHRLEGFGHEIAPSLAAVRNRGPQFVLTNILDPNREVDPKFLQYSAALSDGRIVTGIIAAETATSLTLVKAENVKETVLRVELESLKSSAISLMPEGLEKQIDIPQMADLLAYILKSE